MLRLIIILINLFRSSLFLIILIVGLGITLVQTSLKLANLTAQVATLTAAAATTAQQKKRMTKILSKEKAKARLKRLIVAVPFLGVGASIAFEAGDLKNWLRENPTKDAGDYGCEVTSSSAEVVDEVLSDLPKNFRPSKGKIMGKMPECN